LACSARISNLVLFVRSMLLSFCLSSAVLCVGVEAGRQPRVSPEDVLVADAEVAVVGDAEVSHQNTNARCKARNPLLTSPETKNASFDYWFGWYDVQGCGRCYDYCKWRGTLGGNFPNPVRRMSEYWLDPGPDFPGPKYNQWSCALSGDKSALWTPPLGGPAQFDRWRFARCSGEGAVAPRQPCWKLHTARHIPWPTDCSKNSSASTGPYVPFWWRLKNAQRMCETSRYCLAIELQPDKCGGRFRIVDTDWGLSLTQRTDEPDGRTNRVWFYSPDCRDLRYKCSLFNHPPAKNHNRRFVPTVDDGYTNMYRGWYDVQGCGRCYDYCRWVGDRGNGYANPRYKREIKSSWYSCRLAGTFEDKTPPGYFKTWNFRGCGWNGGPGGKYK